MTDTSASLFPAASRSLAALIFVTLAGCVSCGAMSRNIAREATPAAVDSGMEEASSRENQRELVDDIEPEIVEDGTSKMAAGTTDGLIEALAEEERQERLAAAMEPLVASIVDTSVDSALSDRNLTRVRELSKQATLGFQDAIDEVEQMKQDGRLPDDEGNVLQAADEMAESWDMILYALGALAAVLALMLIAGTWWVLRRKRNYEADTARRDREIEKITRMLASEGLDPNDGQEASFHEGNEADHDKELRRQAMGRVAKRRSHYGANRAPKQ